MKLSLSKTTVRIPLLYALFGALWILMTDRLLFLLVPTLPQFGLWQTVKGWLFVAVSTGVFYLLLAAAERRQQKLEASQSQSETRYRLLFNHNPLPMWVYDQETLAFLAVNETAVKTYGYSRSEFLQMTLRDIRPPEDVNRLMADVAQGWPVLNYAGEWRHQRQDGAIFPVEITSHSLTYNGRPARLVVAHDITEQKKAETALRESEARFRRLAENAQDLIYRYIFVPEPHFAYVSPAATKMTGFTPQEHYDDPQLGYKLVHPDDRPLLEAVAEGHNSLDKPLRLRWVHKDGRIIWTEQRNTPIFDESGTPVAIEGVARDVTEQVEAEQALRESERRFRKAIEEAPFPITIHAEDGEILTVSHTWTEITGYAHSDIPTITDWTEKAYGGRQELVRAEIDRLYGLNRRVAEGEYRITCKDGTQRVWEFSSTPLGALPDGRRCVISMAVDVTERKETENRLRLQSAALEAAANAIVITDLNGNLEWTNAAFTELTGYAREEALGQNPRDLLRSGRHSREFYQDMWQTILSGEVWRGEIINRRKNGALYTEEQSITPVQNDEGTITHFIAIKQDISERKQAVAERERLLTQVQAQAEQLTQIMNSVPEGVCLLDSVGVVLVANPRAEEQLALLAKAEIGDTLTQIGALPLDSLLTSPSLGGRHDVEVNGRLFRIIAKPLESGPVAQGWVLVLREVTEQHMVQQQLQRQERLAAIGQLAAGIAHDFNNIMAVIVLYAQLLKNSPNLNEKEQQRLATVNQQANRAAQLIQQILDFSRQAVLEQRPLDLLPLLKEEVKLLQRTLPEHIEIEMQYEQDDVFVQADPTRMQQVLMNLALNARDAMPTGGKLLIALDEMRVQEEKQAPLPGMAAGAWIKLTVTDSGTGIEPTVLDHVFEPFFTTKQPGKGAGLGLAQVHGIVGQHGGYITVDSEVGVGSTFTIYLPALKVETAVLTADEDQLIPHGDGELVLIVEDNDALREAMIESLTRWQYKALEAEDGEKALALLQERSAEIDLVVSDVVMPRLGGIRLLRAMHQQGWKIPVILLSGHPLNEVKSSLKEPGAFITLAKPVEMARLAQVIADALNYQAESG